MLPQGARAFNQLTGHAGRAVQEGLPVNAQKSGGQQPHGGKHGVAPAQIVRNFQRSQTVQGGLLPQIAGCGVGNHHHVVMPALAQSALKPLAHQKILGQGFNGAARFADADHGRVRRVKAAKQGFKFFSAHVVGNPQARAVMARPVLARSKGFLQCPRAQSRTAYAQNNHVFAGSHLFKDGRQIPLKRRPVRH